MTLYSTGKAFRFHPASWSSRTALFTSASPTWPQTSAGCVTTCHDTTAFRTSQQLPQFLTFLQHSNTAGNGEQTWNKHGQMRSARSKCQEHNFEDPAGFKRVNWKRHVRHLHNMQVSSGCRISNAASSSSSFILEMVPKQPKTWKSWPNQILILRIENAVCQVIDLTLLSQKCTQYGNRL